MPMDGMEHEETGTLEELGIEFDKLRWLNLYSEGFLESLSRPFEGEQTRNTIR